jgi:hypothetical protein
MKIRIEVEFRKIGEEEITPIVIEREKGIEKSTERVMVQMADNLKRYLKKGRVDISEPTAEANTTDGKLKGILEFEVQKVTGIRIQPQVVNRFVINSFRKDMEGISQKYQDYFREKRIETNISFKIN